MSWLWIALAAWLVLAAVTAVLFGRVVKRADREELGSTLDWDPTTLDTDREDEVGQRAGRRRRRCR